MLGYEAGMTHILCDLHRPGSKTSFSGAFAETDNPFDAKQLKIPYIVQEGSFEKAALGDRLYQESFSGELDVQRDSETYDTSGC
ncbi:hypothetical protein PTTG_29640 [Puccinia triticina 1-1 BBBD Race 1]|uniref:Uncharacterized protein n=2 Tax=Puccinia triticina TaxID=208348 RepID=A0A180G3E2_PUCT1|nr:uncharacterized protein PtA15_16A230 [Puccinia triticina]OAV86969.1 hypothetical protein PTTG_29640 [Puccinia triticina 1-1 BBBD Race 1]WAQ92324.1 hypothetical protein PtA15_16A230 [Puccinia triticina]WAR64057.1 hypothetical protein PtB15_16B216 [Puccinia triticina]